MSQSCEGQGTAEGQQGAEEHSMQRSRNVWRRPADSVQDGPVAAQALPNGSVKSGVVQQPHQQAQRQQPEQQQRKRPRLASPSMPRPGAPTSTVTGASQAQIQKQPNPPLGHQQQPKPPQSQPTQQQPKPLQPQVIQQQPYPQPQPQRPSVQSSQQKKTSPMPLTPQSALAASPATKAQSARAEVQPPPSVHKPILYPGPAHPPNPGPDSKPGPAPSTANSDAIPHLTPGRSIQPVVGVGVQSGSNGARPNSSTQPAAPAPAKPDSTLPATLTKPFSLQFAAPANPVRKRPAAPVNLVSTQPAAPANLVSTQPAVPAKTGNSTQPAAPVKKGNSTLRAASAKPGNITLRAAPAQPGNSTQPAVQAKPGRTQPGATAKPGGSNADPKQPSPAAFVAEVLAGKEAAMQALKEQLLEKERLLARQRELTEAQQAQQAQQQHHQHLTSSQIPGCGMFESGAACDFKAQVQKRKAQLTRGFAALVNVQGASLGNTAGPDVGQEAVEKVERITADEWEIARVLNSHSDLGCLKLQLGASQAQVRRGYRVLAAALHPDKCKLPSAAEAFQRVNSAYKALEAMANT